MSVYRTIGPTLVLYLFFLSAPVHAHVVKHEENVYRINL